MTSLGELIEFTRHQLSGLDSSKDAISALRLPMTNVATTLEVEDTNGASTGIAEIDFEQMRVRSVNGVDASVTLWPFGRGYRGTTATVHAAGVEVRFNPEWPASTVAREINGVLTELYPAIYAVRTHETTAPMVWGGIDVPADAIGVISVWAEPRNYTGEWVRVDRWDFNQDATDSGRGLNIFGGIEEGVNLRIVYAARPALFNLNGALSQDYATVTGLDTRTADLISLGVARRLAPFIDVSKLPSVAAAAADAGANKAPGVGANAARLLTQLFQMRLADEQAVLTREHPIRVHRAR